MTDHYRSPGRGTKVLNAVVAWLTCRGVSVWGSRILEVPGRRSGLPRRTPVNLLDFEGKRYLVAPRGQTEWVRNVRAAGGRLTLLLGSRREDMSATELEGDDKLPVLRAYLRRWKFEVGQFFDGVDHESPEERLRQEASKHPVFRLQPR